MLFALWGTTRGRTSIRVNRVEICSDRIPEAFDGFRFVQITDMHVGTLVRPERELTRLADSVNAQRPEAVFFTGDLVNIRAGELDERTTALLRRIAGPVWSVTGNHDVGTYIKDSLRFPAAGEAREVVARQRAMGWTVLEDTTVYDAVRTASRSRGCRSTPRCANAATTATCRERPFPRLTPEFRIRSTTSPSYISRSSGNRSSRPATAI